MKNSDNKEQSFPKLFAGVWLLITFMNIPYFLVALNIEPSQFLLLDSLFVDIHLGIHHGLIGYITLSLGMLGMYYGTKIQNRNIGNYLFLISLFFLIKGAYLSIEDLIMEQIVHSGVEQKYIWDWKAPEVEIFSLIAFIPGFWMKNRTKLLSLLVPVFAVSIFVTPFGPVTLGYLILLLVFEDKNHQISAETEKNRVLRWTSGIAGICLTATYIAILVGEILMNLF